MWLCLEVDGIPARLSGMRSALEAPAQWCLEYHAWIVSWPQLCGPERSRDAPTPQSLPHLAAASQCELRARATPAFLGDAAWGALGVGSAVFLGSSRDRCPGAWAAGRSCLVPLSRAPAAVCDQPARLPRSADGGHQPGCRGGPARPASEGNPQGDR